MAGESQPPQRPRSELDAALLRQHCIVVPSGEPFFFRLLHLQLGASVVRVHKGVMQHRPPPKAKPPQLPGCIQLVVDVLRKGGSGVAAAVGEQEPRAEDVLQGLGDMAPGTFSQTAPMEEE